MEYNSKVIPPIFNDPISQNIIQILAKGRAITAIELANAVKTTQELIYIQLDSMVKNEIIAVENQGRRVYFKMANSASAQSIIHNIQIEIPEKSKKISSKDVEFRYCRSCYSHLAGKVGVMITSKLEEFNYITEVDDIYEVTQEGRLFFEQFHIDIIELQLKKKIFAKSCLDWSERKHHLGGLLGTALLSKMLVLGWMIKKQGSRNITVTPRGKLKLKKLLDINI